MILRRLARTYQASRPVPRDADQAFSHRGAPEGAESLTPALTGTAPAERSKEDGRLMMLAAGWIRSGAVSGVECYG